MADRFISVSNDVWGKSIHNAIRALGPSVDFFVDCLDSNRNQERVRSVLQSHAGIPIDTFTSKSLAILPASSIDLIQFDDEALFPGYDVVFLVQERMGNRLPPPPPGMTRVAERMDWLEFVQSSLPILRDVGSWMDENGVLCCFAQAGIVVGLGPGEALLPPKARLFYSA